MGFRLLELGQMESVHIACPQVTDQVKTMTGAEDKELALKRIGFLKYKGGYDHEKQLPALAVILGLLLSLSPAACAEPLQSHI